MSRSGTSSNPFRQSSRFRLLITLAGVALIAGIGLVDYWTGPDFSLSVFFLLPISLVTWFIGWQSGVVLSLISAFVWLLIDLSTQPTPLHPLAPYWNAAVRLAFFLTVVYLESALQRLNRDLETRVEQRTVLLATENAERRRIEQRLVQSGNRLAALRQIDQAILSAQSLAAVATTTLLHVKNVLQCDRVSLLLFDYEARTIASFHTNDDSAAPVIAGEGPIETAVEFEAFLQSISTEGPVAILDTSQAQPEQAVIDLLQAQKARWLAILPILVQTERIGSLNLMSNAPVAFQPEHLEVGEEIADLLGIVVKQATLVRQLHADQAQLQALSHELLEVQEAERRKLARELHDEIGQELTGLRLSLELAARAPQDRLAEQLAQSQELVIDLMERVSQLSLELRPAILDDLGLLPALLWYTSLYESRTGITVQLRHSQLEGRRFEPEVETAAFRMVQESLTNVARHAQVRQARVACWYHQDLLGVQVEDEGVGFAPDQPAEKYQSGGLTGMQERILLLNGRLTIESNPQQGTRLLAEIPILGQPLESDQA
jgi:signal transduction histidine kinase